MDVQDCDCNLFHGLNINFYVQFYESFIFDLILARIFSTTSFVNQNLFDLFQAPVENGKNGVSHEDGAETVTPPASDATGKRPLDSDTTGNGNQEDKSEPECKRVCSDNGSEEMGKAAETQECVSEAPNGVNNTPQPITSGGD